MNDTWKSTSKKKEQKHVMNEFIRALTDGGKSSEYLSKGCCDIAWCSQSSGYHICTFCDRYSYFYLTFSWSRMAQTFLYFGIVTLH